MPLKLVKNDGDFWLQVVGVKHPVEVNIHLDVKGSIPKRILEEVAENRCPSPGVYSSIISELTDLWAKAKMTGDRSTLVAGIGRVINKYGSEEVADD